MEYVDATLSKLSPHEEKLAQELASQVRESKLRGAHSSSWREVMKDITAEALHQETGAARHGPMTREKATRLEKLVCWRGMVRDGLKELQHDSDCELVKEWALKTLLYLKGSFQQEDPFCWADFPSVILSASLSLDFPFQVSFPLFLFELH